MKIRAIMAVTLIISMCVFADNIDASSAGVSEKPTAASVNEQTTDDGTTGDLFSFLDDNNDGDEVSATSAEASESSSTRSVENGSKSVTKAEQPSKSDAKSTGKESKNTKQADKPKQESKHEHCWEAVYETVTVEDIGNELHEYCKGCGADITSWSNSTWIAHSNKHIENGEQSGFYEKEIKVVTATHQVQKRTGWKCSCGATK